MAMTMTKNSCVIETEKDKPASQPTNQLSTDNYSNCICMTQTFQNIVYNFTDDDDEEEKSSK